MDTFECACLPFFIVAQYKLTYIRLIRRITMIKSFEVEKMCCPNLESFPLPLFEVNLIAEVFTSASFACRRCIREQ